MVRQTALTLRSLVALLCSAGFVRTPFPTHKTLYLFTYRGIYPGAAAPLLRFALSYLHTFLPFYRTHHTHALSDIHLCAHLPGVLPPFLPRWQLARFSPQYADITIPPTATIAFRLTTYCRYRTRPSTSDILPAFFAGSYIQHQALATRTYYHAPRLAARRTPRLLPLPPLPPRQFRTRLPRTTATTLAHRAAPTCFITHPTATLPIPA